MTGSSRRLGVALFTVMAVSAARCAYSPDPASGTLHCGPGSSCPKGYTCADQKTCWKDGETPSGAAGTGAAGMGAAGVSGAAGTGAAGMAMPGPGNFVGHWVYQTGSTETVSCSDGSDKNNDLTSDYVDVALNTGTLTATYFCAWIVTLDSNMTTTVIKAGQSCSRNTTDATTGVTHFTWHGTTFAFKTTDAKTATLQATIGVDYLDDATKTGCGPTATPCAGTCTIKIDGTLDKSP
jgi:hypothetical protein